MSLCSIILRVPTRVLTEISTVLTGISKVLTGMSKELTKMSRHNALQSYICQTSGRGLLWRAGGGAICENLGFRVSKSGASQSQKSQDGKGYLVAF